MSNGQKIGYARVSTAGQNLGIQEQRLKEYGCHKIFAEKYSGRPGLKRIELGMALDYVREGDVFVTTKLDRLARNVADLANIVEQLESKKVDLVVLDQAIDTTTSTGRLLFHMIGAIGEFERELIKERTQEGREAAKVKGVKFGRKPAIEKMGEKRLEALVSEFDKGLIPREDLATKYKVSRATLYRLVAQAKKANGYDPNQITMSEILEGNVT